MDLPLTRGRSALDRLADMTEDVCKEYRGCCIGMRFLHPVWFIDEATFRLDFQPTFAGMRGRRSRFGGAAADQRFGYVY